VNLPDFEIFNSLLGIVLSGLIFLIGLFAVVIWIALPIFLWNSMHRIERSLRELVNMMVNINVHTANAEASARRLVNFFEGRTVELMQPEEKESVQPEETHRGVQS
jgi:hypothetical protein